MPIRIAYSSFTLGTSMRSGMRLFSHLESDLIRRLGVRTLDVVVVLDAETHRTLPDGRHLRDPEPEGHGHCWSLSASQFAVMSGEKASAHPTPKL